MHHNCLVTLIWWNIASTSAARATCYWWNLLNTATILLVRSDLKTSWSFQDVTPNFALQSKTTLVSPGLLGLNTGCWGQYHSSLSSTMDLSLELYICVPLYHVISNGSFVFSNRLTSHRNLFWNVRHWLPPGMNQSITAINQLNSLHHC